MHRLKPASALLFCLLATNACAPLPLESYSNKGDPEQQLTLVSDIVSIDLSTPGALGDLSTTLAKKPPTRALFNCPPEESGCTQAHSLMDQRHIPVQETSSGANITLLYDQITARSCENRYIDSFNTTVPAPDYGCSVRSNTVQMVTDKRQFVSPSLQDLPSGEKAGQAYKDYLKPPAASQTGTTSSSIINSSVSQ